MFMTKCTCKISLFKENTALYYSRDLKVLYREKGRLKIYFVSKGGHQCYIPKAAVLMFILLTSKSKKFFLEK